jgi:hypothetical protein
MPFSHQIDHDAGKMWTKVVGPIHYSDIVEHLKAEVGEAGQIYPEIIDATQAKAAFTPVEARQVVNTVRQIGEKSMLGPTAVVVSDDITYGMLRMLSILLEDVCAIQVFRQMDEAERWLGWKA